ncbi:hypothetical protein BYT27DRAFT_7260726 [Phlegmacium glaucopus]|nr:hypothetical protein BYT27DRAFT_7260726 [Phlegmacium glaucopus]
MLTLCLFNNYTIINGDVSKSDHSRTTTDVDSFNTTETTHSSQPLTRAFRHDTTLTEPRTPPPDSPGPSNNIHHQTAGGRRTSTSPSNDVEYSYPPSPRFTHSNSSSDSLDDLSITRNATTTPVAKDLRQYISHKITGWSRRLLGYVCMKDL